MNGDGVNIRVPLSFLQVSSTAFIMLMRIITFEVFDNRDSGHIASDNPLLFHRFAISPFNADLTSMEFIFVRLVLRQETP